MYTENSLIDDRSQGQEVKYLGAISPHINGTIFSQALIIEAIYLSNLPTFVISSD